MCGTLRFGRDDTSVAKIGNPVPVRNVLTGAEGRAVWSGFAQQEKLSWWEDRGNGVPIAILADTFVEGHVEFRIPTGELTGLGLRRDVFVNGKQVGWRHTFKIVTRPAQGTFEKGIHSRFPLTFTLNKNSSNTYIFTLNDAIIGRQAELFNA